MRIGWQAVVHPRLETHEKGAQMRVFVHTDHNIAGSDHLTQHVESEVSVGLSRFAEHLTRVEVHLSDEVGGRSQAGMKNCTVESRTVQASPIAVTHHAANLEDALTGAIHKLAKRLATQTGRRDDRVGRASIRRSGAQ